MYTLGLVALDELAESAEAAKDKKRGAYRAAASLAARNGEEVSCMVSFLTHLLGGSKEACVYKAWEKAEGKRLKRASIRGRGTTGSAASAAAGTSGSGRPSLSDVLCYNCDNRGHYARFCKLPPARGTSSYTPTGPKKEPPV